MASAVTDESLISTIVERVAAYDIRNWGPYPGIRKDFKRAAVLLALTVRNGEVFILLTKRSKDLRSHPSTVAFPGGMRDETDSSDIETALREAEEEIGLPPSSVQILGILTRGVTLPSTVVYPIVGLIPSDFVPVPNPSEVEFAFYMPLNDFLNEEKITMSTFNVRGRQFLSRAVVYSDGEKTANVWGFTANYCTLLAKIVFDQTDPFPVFNEEVKGKGLYDELIGYFNHIMSAASLKSKL